MNPNVNMNNQYFTNIPMSQSFNPMAQNPNQFNNPIYAQLQQQAMMNMASSYMMSPQYMPQNPEGFGMNQSFNVNTSGLNLNNSMPNITGTPPGLGLMMNTNPQMFHTNRFMQESMYPTAHGYPQNPMQQQAYFSQSLSNSLNEQIRQYELNQAINKQFQDEKERLQREEDKNSYKNFEEELKNMIEDLPDLIKLSKSVEVMVNRSEYFNYRDRFFFEQLIQQPLKTSGFFGTDLVTTLDKSMLFDRADQRVSSSYTPDAGYFSKMAKDGIYVDIIKNRIYTYNLQKVEQRALREGKLDWFKYNGDLRLDNDIFNDVVTKPLDISFKHK